MTDWLSEDELKRFKKVGRGCKVSRLATIYGHENVQLGDNVRIDANVMILAAAEYSSFSCENHVHVAAGAILAAGGGIVLRSFTAVGFGSKLVSATDDFSGDFLIGPTFPDQYRNVKKNPIVLERGSFLGTDCIVLAGVHLADWSCGGARTTFNRSTEPFVIYAGTPAKALRKRSEKCVELAKKFEHDWHLQQTF